MSRFETNDKYSLSGKVFHQLKEDILEGKYKQKDELREISIGKELGVSRTPVREALRQLELEGLVNIIPNKGAYVNAITPEDVQDIYMIRARLEGLCASMAAERISSEELAEMEEIIILSEFHEKKQHYDQLLSLDSRFHETLYSACKSKILEHLLKDFHHYVQKVRKKSLSYSGRAEKSTKEHEAILKAIKEHDPEQADTLTTLHIMNTIKNFSHYKMENILENQEEAHDEDSNDNPVG